MPDRPALECSASGAHHAVALALRPLPLASVMAAARVSPVWNAAAVEALASFSALDLRPFGAGMTDEALGRLLASTPSLRVLNLATCAHISDRGLAQLADHCPLLARLNLACLPLVTAGGLAPEVDAFGPQLEELELSGCVAISEAELLRRFARFLDLDEDPLAKVQ